jgi:glycosyltransferase involved in cell wall biosynthesis
MLKNKRIAVVVPCYNEEGNVLNVLSTMPDFVDFMIVVDDASIDQTVLQVESYIKIHPHVHLIQLQTNSGVGAAIARGHLYARELEVDVVAVMAGDGQMDPKILSKLIWPVVVDEVDFTKTNRLFDDLSTIDIPKHRFVGNFILSLFTKVASGYWKISDAQSGYTAIGRRGLEKVPWEKMYPRYGQPNDLLITLNILNLRVADVYTPPRYNVGEKSKMKIKRVIFTIPKILWMGFWRRIWKKYVVQNSNPLVILYLAGFTTGLVSILLFLRLLFGFLVTGDILLISAILFSFSALFALQCFSFAMWFDLQQNEKYQLTYALEDIIVDK